MRVALVHNLQTDDSEAQAEFDTPATIAALVSMLRRLGHDVTAIDVSRSLGAAIVELEELAPDLVFNTAEGRGGPLREALFPALFEELGLPFTGSGPFTCATTLDKHRTKALVAAAEVPVAAGVLIEDAAALDQADLSTWPLPAIVKPNYEGSSKGVSADSIVRDPSAFPAVVTQLLARYPVGVLIEAFIPGRDVTVPWLEGVGPLPAAEYVFDGGTEAGPSHDVIYDYARKQHGDRVRVQSPAKLDAAVAAQIEALSARVVTALGIHDLARLDFRVTPDNQVWFLEVNALPSLEPGASLYESAAVVGLREPEQVLAAVVESAARRQGLDLRPPADAKRKPAGPRVGLIYNVKRVDPRTGDDRDAEFDSRETIAAVRGAIERQGVEVIEFEANVGLPKALSQTPIDLAFNIAEGIGGRGREGQVPALLELLGIPHTGSDAVTMGLTLDKTLAKSVVAAAGISTPAWATLHRADDRLPPGLRYPVFVKPAAEGSSKGIDARAIAHDEAALRERADYLIRRYAQPALVESYLPGREFTVGILAGREPAVLPAMEVVHLDAEAPAVYGFEAKTALSDGLRYDAPAKVTPELGQAIADTAMAVFEALGCRDFARIDLRLDEAGQVHFLECNPLPGLTPGWSDLCMIATSAGLDYDQLIAAILAPALARAVLSDAGAPTP